MPAPLNLGTSSIPNLIAPELNRAVPLQSVRCHTTRCISTAGCRHSPLWAAPPGPCLLGRSWATLRATRAPGGDPVHMLAQAPPSLGGSAGLPAHHQRTAHTLFQQPNALRNGRRCHMKCACSPLKAALFDNGSQRRKRCIVQHGISFT